MANIVKLNYTAEEINEKLGKVDDVVQTKGDSETAVMSQKAVTQNLDAILEAFDTYGGNNLLDPNNVEAGYYENTNGVLTEKSGRDHLRTIVPISVKPESLLYLMSNVADDADSIMAVILINDTNDVIGQKTYKFSVLNSETRTATIPSDVTKVHIWINGVTNGRSFNDVCVSEVQLAKFEEYGTSKMLTALKYNKLPSELTDKLDDVSCSEQVIDNFQSMDGWYNKVNTEDIATSISSDMENYLFGSQSIRFEGGIKKDNLGIDVRGREFRIKLKINSLDTGAYLRLYVINSEGKDAYWILCKGNQGEKTTITPFGEWIELVLPWSALSNASVSAYSTIRTIAVQSVNGNCDVNIQMISLDERRESKGIVTFAFDDSNVTDYTKAAPILGARGIAATAYVIPDLIKEGRSGFLSEEQLVSLKLDYNWDIEGHWAVDMGGMSKEELSRNFNSVKTYIREKGLGNCDHFAYAGGDLSGEVEKMARKYFTTARTIHRAFEYGIGSQNSINCHRLPAISAINDIGDTGGNLDYVRESIRRVAEYGGWLILVFHVIGDGDTTIYCSEQGLADIADYAIASGVDIKTVDEVMIGKEASIQLLTENINQKTIPYDNVETKPYFVGRTPLEFTHKQKQLDSDGELVDAIYRNTTDFISISDTHQIYATITNGVKYQLGSIAYYDKNKSFIKFANIGTNYEFITIDNKPYSCEFPIHDVADAVYVRLSINNEYSTIECMITPNVQEYSLDGAMVDMLPNEDVGKLITNNLKKKKIVCIGDSIFGNNQGSTGVVNQIADRMSATIINGAFGGTRMSLRSTTTTGYDKFDFPSIAQAISIGDYSAQDQALEDYNLPKNYPASLQSLKDTDFNTVDTIVFNYGTNDWTSGIDQSTYKTAMENNIKTILTAYPHIKFIAVTPTWRCTISDGTIIDDSDSKTYGERTLPDVISDMENVAETILHIPVIDCYNIGINKYNFTNYFDGTDGTHQNANGRELLARRIVQGLF